ncbi:hypothetical protein, partial [Vibrio metschnikovii]|uniref:hypothetical protein n=1 Tax=Vibrio metschnikovii TaxID=28172 RepID=UPI002FC5B01B
MIIQSAFEVNGQRPCKSFCVTALGTASTALSTCLVTTVNSTLTNKALLVNMAIAAVMLSHSMMH